MNKDLLYNKTLSSDSSFQLVRTNPKLTGNIALTINETGGMWLDAIRANSELSKDDYSKFPIDTTQSLGANVYQFFKNGTTPSEIVFDLTERVDSTKTSKDFKDQYDFSHYFSGIKYFPSNKYEERLSYFAPLYLKKTVPNYFIILKIKDPLNDPIDTSKLNYEAGQSKSDYLINLFKDATIIKTFDLTENSIPGKYIRNYLNSKNFPISPLSVAFGEEDYTTWNGIVISSGILGSKGELLYDEYKKSSPLKFFEETITKGYERNGVIFPNILNLQFIFNDDTSSKYEFNRYLGLYVDSIAISNLDIDLDRMYDERKSWQNTPRLRREYKESEETILIQENSAGVIVPYKNLDFNMSEFEDVFSNSEKLYFNYITDKYDKFYLPKLDDSYNIDFSPTITVDLIANGATVTVISSDPHGYETDDLVIINSSVSSLSGSYFVTKISNTVFSYVNTTAAVTTTGSAYKDIGVGKLRLSNVSIDTAKFFGPSDFFFLQDKGEVSNFAGFAYSVIKINAELNNLDEIRLYYPNGTRSDANGKYDIFTSAVNYPFVPNPGNYYAFNDYDNVAGHDVFYFNGKGLTKEIAQAIAGCINSVRNRTITAYPYNEYIFIKCNVAGDFDNLHKLTFDSPTLNYSALEIDETTGSELVNSIFPFKGGSRNVRNRLIINKDQLEKINLELENLLVKTESGWSKIKKTAGYVDLVNEENLDSEAAKTKAISDFENKAVIVLENNEAADVRYFGDYIIRKKFRPEFGIFSLYPIKDISFDFYSSDYLNFPIIDLYENFYVPEGVALLEPGETYYVTTPNAFAKINDPSTQAQSSTSIILSSITSSSTVTINVGIGSYGFSAAFDPFQMIKVQYDPENYFFGNVDSFNSTTGDLTLFVGDAPTQVKYQTALVSYSSWQVYQIAAPLNNFNQFVPFKVSQNCSYSNDLGFPVVSYFSTLFPGQSLIYPIQDQNEELKNFSGFSILKDPAKVTVGNSTLDYLLRDKFTNGITTTEYDFYKENESLDFALRSKVIPYITKWAIKNGLDSRDNPYRLNTEIVFGRNNFSPDHTDKTQNPNNFTHEWFYIESKFNYLDTEETAKLNNYYFDTPLDITKLLSDPDYFIEYFTYTPKYGVNQYGEGLEIAPTQFRYSNIFKNKSGQYETFFKGFKIVFNDVNDPNVFGLDGKPVPKAQTSRFEGYKFSCILKPIKEDFFDRTQPPIKYRFIEHKDYKFIALVIEVSLGAIDQINDYWKDIPSSTPLYVNTISDTLPASPLSPFYPFLPPREVYYAFKGSLPTTVFENTYAFETIYGDYRFSFSQVDGVDISNLNHSLLYSIKNKKYNARLDNFSNVKLSSQLKLSVAGQDGVNIIPGTPVTGTIRKDTITAIENYPSLLSDEIIPTIKLGIVAALDQASGTYYFIDQRDPTFVALKENPVTVAFEEYVEFVLGATGVVDISAFIAVGSYPFLSIFQDLPLSSGLTNAIKNNFSFFVIGGGRFYFEKLFQKLSFAKFKEYANSLNPIIEFESYALDENGISQLQAQPKYYVDIPDTSFVQKTSQLIVNSDIDTPTQYSSQDIIGYQYERGTLNNSLELNRYKGEYEPIVRDILYCKSNFTFTKNKINDLKLANVHLNTKIADFLTITNFNHLKISSAKVLDLESDTSYLPLYPKINEVAIGQAPYFLLNSNWDWGFHYRYADKKVYSPIAGSIRVEEDENFLGKILTVPAEIELEQFDLLTLPEDQTLVNVDIDGVEMVIKEGTQTIDGYINLNNAITSYLINDGIENKFNQYLINSNEYIGNYASIQEYVKEYINLNILKLYEVFEVDFFSKRSAELFTTTKVKNPNRITFSFLTDEQRIELGYTEFKSVQINKFERLILSFRIQKSVAAGLTISPKIKIKFI